MTYNFKLPLPYILITCYSIILIILGLSMDSFQDIISGLKSIVLNSDILITDYIELGGIGATFINSSLVLLSYISLLTVLKIKPTGSITAALFTVAGFSLFGKNIANIWPIIFGIWLYSKYQKEPFSNYIIISLFGTTLSPTVTQLIIAENIPVFISTLAGLCVTIFIGFLLPPMASYALKFHQGYNLYNIGFAAGLLGTLLMSVLRAFGINFSTRLIWSTGNNTFFATLFISLFLLLIIIGYFLNEKSFKNIFKLYKHSGRLISDYYMIFGKGITLINMGLLGLLSTIVVLLINGDLNGPTLGGILTITGFGAFGKHLKNVIPIMIGALLCSFLNIWPVNSPNMLLSILFSTTLAPLSGSFGWHFGIIAGFLHTCMVMNIGYLHGGLILYNNGFSGGLICMILVPLITAFRKEV
jgi:Protein of unknown function (DUF1576)